MRGIAARPSSMSGIFIQGAFGPRHEGKSRITPFATVRWTQRAVQHSFPVDPPRSGLFTTDRPSPDSSPHS